MTNEKDTKRDKKTTYHFYRIKYTANAVLLQRYIFKNFDT